ncbi:MAG: ABC transporter ATP-binding protein [Oscillospiraceae bacterium]
MSEFIAEINHISKKLKGKIVLDDITVSFERGKIYGIIGANASGKTMLFRAIAGLLYLTNGEIIYNPSHLTLGVIVENPGFLLSYTGYENLKFLASIRKKISNSQIVDSMQAVGLDSTDTRKVKAYSLGMKQKLAIAQAIMETPDMLILDEPTRGLDQESIDNIRKLLLSINREGTTILISSHNADDISALCSEVYTMEKGKLV